MQDTLFDRIKGCLIGGAIGDAVGSFYENRAAPAVVDFDIPWQLTDDTQLTLATAEAIIASHGVVPEQIALKLLEWYNRGKLTGLGASTLKALRDLQAGAHWALAGRSGEYAAGNGAAMRIAPLAFFMLVDNDRRTIQDVCNITHKNDEAYTAALSVLLALDAILRNHWAEEDMLIQAVTPTISDTRVKDNLMILQNNPRYSIQEAAARIGCSGHAAESVPLALFAAGKVRRETYTAVLSDIIRCGGDTDTTASIAGQVMGTYLGYGGLPVELVGRLGEVNEIVRVSEQLCEVSRSKA